MVRVGTSATVDSLIDGSSTVHHSDPTPDSWALPFRVNSDSTLILLGEDARGEMATKGASALRTETEAEIEALRLPSVTVRVNEVVVPADITGATILASLFLLPTIAETTSGDVASKDGDV